MGSVNNMYSFQRCVTETTGNGFWVFIPLISRNYINFFWRRVTPPFFSLCRFAFLPANLKDSVAAVKGCAGGGCSKRETHTGNTERRREEGGQRWIDFHLQQLQFKASQQTSEIWQDPACPQPGQAACLRAGLPPGARDSQAAQKNPKTIMHTGKGVWGHKQVGA